MHHTYVRTMGPTPTLVPVSLFLIRLAHSAITGRLRVLSMSINSHSLVGVVFCCPSCPGSGRLHLGCGFSTGYYFISKPTNHRFSKMWSCVVLASVNHPCARKGARRCGVLRPCQSNRVQVIRIFLCRRTKKPHATETCTFLFPATHTTFQPCNLPLQPV